MLLPLSSSDTGRERPHLSLNPYCHRPIGGWSINSLHLKKKQVKHSRSGLPAAAAPAAAAVAWGSFRASPLSTTPARVRRMGSSLMPWSSSPAEGMGVALLGLVLLRALRWLVEPIVKARRLNGAEEKERIKWEELGDGSGADAASPQVQKGRVNPQLSVVIPAYNEEARLPPVLEETLDYLNREDARKSGLTFEIIVVDDGSRDRTGEIVRERMRKNGPGCIRMCILPKNTGKGAALRNGMLGARGDYLLMADADGATDIADLEKLMNEMKSAAKDGHGVVIGSRAHMESESLAKRSFLRTILMWGFHLCVKVLCSNKVRDTQCGFKLFTRSTGRLLFGTLRTTGWAFDTEIVYLAQKMGHPIREVAVNWTEVEGSKLIVRKLDVITTSLTMLRDMLCIRLCYATGLWTVQGSSGSGKKEL